jgi:hypothetical protein
MSQHQFTYNDLGGVLVLHLVALIAVALNLAFKHFGSGILGVFAKDLGDVHD